MADKVEWGPEIEVNGVRPSWLRDECGLFKNGSFGWIGQRGEKLKSWSWDCGKTGVCPKHIRLPADHPYYLATDMGFTYWPGGETAPDDWDKCEVLLRDGGPIKGTHISRWSWMDIPDDIIGYRKAATPIAGVDLEGNLRGMSEGAAEELLRRAEGRGGFVHPEWSLPQSRCVDMGVATPWAIARARDELGVATAWAIARARDELGLRDDVPLTPPSHSAVMNFARYIEKHEKPPVDPDVLAVRDILAAHATALNAPMRAKDMLAGEWDEGASFLDALAAYRRHRGSPS